ncbi:unnamed protein product [Cunninghamella blakesleeana]
MSIHKLDESIFLRIISYLSLQDVQTIGQTCKKLQDEVYNNPKIWDQLLFPIQDTRITDKYIQQLVPQITRHYGVHHLKLIRLPLTWKGYFFIFDQFGHSIDKIQLETNHQVIVEMVYHLCIFACTLTILQQENNIPITFRQYCLEPEVYYQLLIQHQFLSHHYLNHVNQEKNEEEKKKRIIKDLIQHAMKIKPLDDPPFERLHEWYTTFTPSSFLSEKKEEETTLLSQLQSIVSFLANNRHLITLPSLLGQKRSQDPSDPTSSSSRIKQRLLSSSNPSTSSSSVYV